MRHPISVQPQSTYQSSNSQLRIFIIFRRHIGAYHGPNLIFNSITVTCNITCVSFEVICLCRVVVLRGFLGRARENCNTTPFFSSPPPLSNSLYKLCPQWWQWQQWTNNVATVACQNCEGQSTSQHPSTMA